MAARAVAAGALAAALSRAPLRHSVRQPAVRSYYGIRAKRSEATQRQPNAYKARPSQACRHLCPLLAGFRLVLVGRIGFRLSGSGGYMYPSRLPECPQQLLGVVWCARTHPPARTGSADSASEYASGRTCVCVRLIAINAVRGKVGKRTRHGGPHACDVLVLSIPLQ